MPVSLVTAVDEPGTLPTAIAGSKGALDLTLGHTTRVAVYDITGRKVCDRQFGPGRHSVTLAPAIYIVKAGSQTAKVMVR